MKVAVTFLKSKYSKEDTIKKIMETDADYIHVDMMDGVFVPRVVLPIDETVGLLKNSKKPLDIHLMVAKPQNYISELSKLNANYISIHVELNEDINELIDLIHSYGINAGLAINPGTSIDALTPYLDNIEYIIIMGATPGYGGQPLQDVSIKKIGELKSLREQYNYHYKMSLDCGVNKNTRSLLDDLDIVVSGSYICESEDYQEAINTLR